MADSPFAGDGPAPPGALSSPRLSARAISAGVAAPDDAGCPNDTVIVSGMVIETLPSTEDGCACAIGRSGVDFTSSPGLRARPPAEVDRGDPIHGRSFRYARI